MNEKIDFLQKLKLVLNENEKSSLVEKSNQLFMEQGPLYKQNFASRFILVPYSQMNSVLQEDYFYVSRKIDGEMRTVYFDGDSAKMYSTGGKCEEDFPCLLELSEKLKSKGIKTAAFGAELNFLKDDKSRSRVTDVIHALTAPELHKQLALSPYDIIFLDGKIWKEADYGETHKKLTELFGTAGLVQSVEMQKAESTEQVDKIYSKWVCDEHAEGLVVHPKSNVIYKIKPNHTIDAAVIGFTTTTEKGMLRIRDLLFAVMNSDKKYRVFASSGNGLTNNQRETLFTELSALKVESNYVYTDSRGIAFTMVRPKLVFETTAIDFSSQNSKGIPNKNDILTFDDDKWSFCCKQNGVSTYSLSVVRQREDKTANITDIRTSQISDICPFVKEKIMSKSDLQKSVLLMRKIYKKTTKQSIYVKKFYLWKTNKEESGEYPAFVMQYSYFSSRSQKLTKKVHVSSSVNQLKEKLDSLVSKEIKKGWEYVQQI